MLELGGGNVVEGSQVSSFNFLFCVLCFVLCISIRGGVQLFFFFFFFWFTMDHGECGGVFKLNGDVVGFFNVHLYMHVCF